MNRHDANQVAAEVIARNVGGFEFEWGPARKLTVTEGMATAVIRRALDRGLVVLPTLSGPLDASGEERKP
jgi:hypothetical protein